MFALDVLLLIAGIHWTKPSRCSPFSLGFPSPSPFASGKDLKELKRLTKKIQLADLCANPKLAFFRDFVMGGAQALSAHENRPRGGGDDSDSSGGMPGMPGGGDSDDDDMPGFEGGGGDDDDNDMPGFEDDDDDDMPGMENQGDLPSPPQAEESEEEPEYDDPGRMPEEAEPVPTVPENNPDPEAVSDEEFERAQLGIREHKAKALALANASKESSGGGGSSASDLPGALASYTTVLALEASIGQLSSLTLGRRAHVLLLSSRPLGCLSDCGAALELNPDSATSLRTRGMARRFLGDYGGSLEDLVKGQGIDFDDSGEIIEAMAFVKVSEAKRSEAKRSEAK